MALAVLVILPYSTLSLPGIFEGPINSPGTLQLLAICLIFGGLAAGYDLLFGRTGMLSFGHALYFAAGVYGTDIAHHPGRPAAVAGGAADHHRRHDPRRAARRGRAADRGHRVRHGDAGLRPGGGDPVARDFGGLTGGEEGLPLDGAGLPAGWSG